MFGWVLKFLVIYIINYKKNYGICRNSLKGDFFYVIFYSLSTKQSKHNNSHFPLMEYNGYIM